MDLLNQLREDASRLVDEAAPEVVSALEHIGTPDVLAKLFVSLAGRLAEAVPGIVYPGVDKPLPASVTTHTPTDEEAGATAVVQPNTPVQQVPAQAPVPPQAPQQSTVAELEAKLKAEEQKVAALQSAATPQPQAQPQVSDQTQGQNQ